MSLPFFGNNMSGQIPIRALITAISQSKECEITTEDNHGLSSGDYVRLTDLNSAMPILRGMDQINNKRFKIIVTSDTTFKIYNPITDEAIDSTLFVPYVTGGRVDIIAHNFIYHGDE